MLYIYPRLLSYICLYISDSAKEDENQKAILQLKKELNVSPKEFYFSFQQEIDISISIFSW